MPWTNRPFNYYGTSPTQILDDLTKANDNFEILAQAFVNNNPATQKARDADKVDGYHASQTPSANTIPVAKSDGKLDAEWFPNFSIRVFSASGPSSSFVTSNNTTYTICSVTIPAQSIVPSRGFWYVFGVLQMLRFGDRNTSSGAQDWEFWVQLVNKRSEIYFGYEYCYKPSANNGAIAPRGFALLGTLSTGVSETYVFKMKQLEGTYNITVIQNAFVFYVLLL